jgi:hypothetical protein
MQKCKRDLELPSSDDDDCEIYVSTSCRLVEEALSYSLSISQQPVSKKARQDQTIPHDPRSVTKADVITSDSASDAIQYRASASQEFALITQVSFVVRD